MLRRLCGKGWMRPVTGNLRITGYELAVKNRAELED